MPHRKKKVIAATKSASKDDADADRKPRPKKHGVPAAAPSEDMEPMSKDLTQYVTTKQAEMLGGVATEHINHLLLDGKIKGIKFGKSWMVFVPSLNHYQKTKSPKGRPASSQSQSNSAN